MSESQNKPAHPLAIAEAQEVIPQGQVVVAWSRLPRETDAAWVLFQAFRDQGYPEGPGGRFQPRSLPPLAKSLDLTVDYLRSLSASFQWFARAGAYDRAIDQAKVEAEIGEAVRVRQRHLRLLAKARLYAEGELDKLIAKSQDPELSTATPKELKDLLEFIITKERLLMGEHTDHVLLDGEWKLEDLDLGELEELDRLRKKAKGAG